MKKWKFAISLVALIVSLVVLIVSALILREAKSLVPHPHSFMDGFCTVCGFDRNNYSLGSIGPAGGIVFYDCDADNDSGNADGLVSSDCGWRFLEAAPADITVDGESDFVFGYYRSTADGSNLYVNRTQYYDPSNCTGKAVGTGKRNTAMLVSAMRSNAYLYPDDNYYNDGTATTSNYAAKLCNDYSYGGFDDWFLPSMDELDLMYRNLKENGLGSFVSNTSYWSSSEDDTNFAWDQYFRNGYQDDFYRNAYFNVRAVRAF
ncbi:MAG: DUF1566 domain-containing protein [Sphaerochaetaceae bacterium]|nr:DUF1566 domain-containing protein [Sphaerochaetaceae bacterium]